MNPFQGGGNPNDPQNQMMLMSLQEVDEQNLVFFLMQNGDLVESEDNTKFKKSGILLLRNFTFMMIGGVFLNIQLKRIPKINFLQWPKIIRIPFRIPVLLSPILLLQSSVSESLKNLFFMHQKYYRRINLTRKTGDLRYLDPQGVLQKQFEKKFRDEQ